MADGYTITREKAIELAVRRTADAARVYVETRISPLLPSDLIKTTAKQIILSWFTHPFSCAFLSERSKFNTVPTRQIVSHFRQICRTYQVRG